jgi:hypothetical protein
MLSQQLFHDHTENGMINKRIMIAFIQFAEHLILTEEQRERYLNALVMQAKKLFAVWTHLDRFRREVERLKPIAPVLDKDSPSKHFEISYSQELYLEFDEFLVQYKSSLDYLAQVPVVFFGRQKWNPRSFGDEGRKILKLLRNVLPKEKKHFADDFEQAIFAPHKADIERIVDARDKINHYIEGGVPYEQFAVIGTREKGTVTYQVPMWNQEQTMDDFMEIAFNNHLRFCETFIAFFLVFHLKPGLCFMYEPVMELNSAVSSLRIISEALMPLYAAKHGGKIVPPSSSSQ